MSFLDKIIKNLGPLGTLELVGGAFDGEIVSDPGPAVGSKIEIGALANDEPGDLLTKTQELGKARIVEVYRRTSRRPIPRDHRGLPDFWPEQPSDRLVAEHVETKLMGFAE